MYNCDGIYSTNPFCTKEYNPDEIEKINNYEKLKNYSNCYADKISDDYNDQFKKYNNYCKDKFGNEYIFDDNTSDNIIKCNNPKDIMVKCKLNFDDKILNINNSKPIEHFSVSSEELNNNELIRICVIILFIIFICYIFYKILK